MIFKNLGYLTLFLKKPQLEPMGGAFGVWWQETPVGRIISWEYSHQQLSLSKLNSPVTQPANGGAGLWIRADFGAERLTLWLDCSSSWPAH